MHHSSGCQRVAMHMSVASPAAHLSLWGAQLLSGLCAVAHAADLYFTITFGGSVPLDVGTDRAHPKLPSYITLLRLSSVQNLQANKSASREGISGALSWPPVRWMLRLILHYTPHRHYLYPRPHLRNANYNTYHSSDSRNWKVEYLFIGCITFYMGSF